MTPSLITLGGLELGSFRKVKSLLLLVYVTLEGPTPRRTLATLLWPDAARPEGSLRVALHALREVHPGALGGEDRLSTPVTSDAARLLTLRGEAAWDAYAGPFLHGVPLTGVSAEFEEWVETQRERLARHVQEEALRAAETADPARAADWAARAHRTPGAPPPEADLLRRALPLTLPGSPLEAEIRAELGELDEGTPTPAPTRPARAAARMLGREAELDTLLAWTLAPQADPPAGGAALITGPGGIGKSTLTRELLRELSRLDRPATLVDAEGAASAAELSARLAATLTRGQAAPPTLAALSDHLPPHATVLLDGADALNDLPDLLRALRRDLPGVRWVISSRRSPPGLLGEGDLLLPLAGLPQAPPEADLAQIAASSAAQLFLREAARTRRDLTLTAANAALIAGITRRLQGHPLALALAASWLRVEHLEAVYARVLTEAAQLTPEGGGSDGRRGLNAVARRSWDLLTAEQQHAALRLSVTSDLDPADAPHLGVPAHLIDELLTHNFLEAHQPGTERLRLYPALRGLLTEQAATHPDLITQARADHARHYLTWFTAQPPESPPVDAERDNITSALHTALERGDATAAQIDHFLAHHDRRGLHASGTDTFAALADAAEDAHAPDSVQAAAQIASMWLAYRAGRLLDAQTLAGHFLAGPLAADPTSRMKVLNTLGIVRGRQGQIRGATDLIGQALNVAVELGDEVRQLHYRLNLLTHLTFLGDEVMLRVQFSEIERRLPHLPEMVAWQVRLALLGARLYTSGEDQAALQAEALVIAQYTESSGLPGISVEIVEMAVTTAFRLRQWRHAEDLLKRAANIVRKNPDLRVNPLLTVELLYARARTQQAQQQVAQILNDPVRPPTPWQLVQLVLLVVPDLRSRGSTEVDAWLTQITGAVNVHAQQQREARVLLGDRDESGLPPGQSLDTDHLQLWLRLQFPVGVTPVSFRN
ncbi:ATP-binding protein [Deinococcus sp. JMULE3]|uniref:ATP-binding protein n=1 Tax=Deinococcus sp. JMULE3 TaxID=2518341 RepID=UPI0015755F1D|nr:ATP-binding protein [Deinococcus sp. JMULE3]NTY00338.1 ATP-binding protein [Deinococcus sp. JMULE3]